MHLYRRLLDKMKYREYKILLFFFVFSLLLTLLISPNSYLYDLYGQVDPVFFFDEGKAWMNGMLPYRDFSESKGPLLFLYYGIGYLLSPTNYIGVFWLNCVLYAFIFYLTYRTAYIFLSDVPSSLCVAAFMALAYFNPFVKGDIRSEDLCGVFAIWALYRCCLHLYGDKTTEMKMSLFIVGICVGACFLVKFTFSAMLMIFVLYLVLACKNMIWWVRSLLCVFLGGVVALLPFVLYFASQEGLSYFLEDYFVNTFFLVSNTTNTGEQLSYWQKILSNICMKTSLLVFITSLLSTLLIIPMLKRYKLFPLLSFLLFYFITLQNGVWQYYYASCAIFALFGFVALLIYLRKLHANMKVLSRVLVPLSFFLCIIVNLYGHYRWSKPNLFFQDSFYRYEYYAYAYLMAQIEKPRVLLRKAIPGFWTPAQGVPAIRYWTLATGYSSKIENAHWNAISSHIPDFVMNSIDDEVDNRRMEELDYKRYYIDGSEFVMYSKHRDLKMPPKSIKISKWQILSKQCVIHSIQ